MASDTYGRDYRLAKADEHRIWTQGDFERILDELANLRLDKVISYTEVRYEMTDAEESRWLCFADMYRNWIRIAPMLKKAERSSADGESLEQHLFDMASFALMTIQIGRKQGWL